MVEHAASSGVPKKIVGDEEAEYTYKSTGIAPVAYMQFVPEFNYTVELSGGEVLE
jgi:hypothetical protein